MFSVNEEYRGYPDAPTIEYYYFEGDKREEIEIRVYPKGAEKVSNLSVDYLGKDVEIDGKKFRLIKCSSGVLDLIYDDLPMFSFVNTILEKNLKSYFNRMRSNNKS